MKKIFLVFACIFSITVLAEDPKVEELASKYELQEMVLPKVQTKTLDNGLQVYYLQDTELPVLKLNTYFDFGNAHETFKERGLVDLFMSVWESGGFEGKGPDEIDQESEFYAIELSAESGFWLSSFFVKTLQKNVKKALDLYFGLLRKPTFDKDRIEVVRQSMLNVIKRRNEEPLPIAKREFLQSLYGKTSPHAWLSTPETINAINQESFKIFYEKNVAPNRMKIAATSPLDFASFLDLIQPYFKDWDKKLPPSKDPTQVKKEWQESVEFIHKEGNQTAIVAGHFGEKNFNKDRFKIILANQILGGSSFGSKLGDRIRTDLGLAYGIGSDFGFGKDYASFRMITSTKSESTVPVFEEFKKILSDFVKNKTATEEDLEHAKDKILNQIIFEYESLFYITQQRLINDYFGFPQDYLEILQKEIKSTTLDDLHAILSQYFYPDKLKFMLVGDKTKIKDLNKLKGLQEIPLDNE